MPSRVKTLIIWQRLVPERSIDSWMERVAWAGAENIVVATFPSGKTARLQVYSQTEKRVRDLVRNYGGKLLKVKADAWVHTTAKRIVLPFPPHLCVVSEGEAPAPWKKLPPLLIPAGMAFGTGDHATTAMCLRQLLKRTGGPHKRVLDLGTGSGILALAAAMQGQDVVAMDFDPESIRTAKANHRLNPVEGKIRWVRADVKTWEPSGSFDLITANLFSSLLQEALPRMKRWLRPGCRMVLSGVLKTQLPGVEETLRGLKLETERVLKKGKWVCLVVAK